MRWIVLFSLFYSAAAFSQEQNGSSQALLPSPQSSARQMGQNGLQFSLGFSNFSDVNGFSSSSFSGSGFNSSASSSYSAGTGMEAYDVELGYNFLPDQGSGFYVGSFVRKTIQMGDYNTEFGFVGVRANYQYAFSTHLYTYLGLNVTTLYEYPAPDNSIGNTSYQPNLSGQAGLGWRFSKTFSGFAGYENMAFVSKFSSAQADFSATSTANIYIGGFTMGLAVSL